MRYRTKNNVVIRIPLEVKNNLNNKRNIFENILKEERVLKADKRFTFADTLRFISKKKIFVYNDELVDFVKNKKKQRKNTLI
jgi:hypothetical protein